MTIKQADNDLKKQLMNGDKTPDQVQYSTEQSLVFIHNYTVTEDLVQFNAPTIFTTKSVSFLLLFYTQMNFSNLKVKKLFLSKIVFLFSENLFPGRRTKVVLGFMYCKVTMLENLVYIMLLSQLV